MLPALDLQDAILTAWGTNSRVTAYLIEQMPAALWSATVPQIPSRPIRAIGAHLHNSRCSWIKTLGRNSSPLSPEVAAASPPCFSWAAAKVVGSRLRRPTCGATCPSTSAMF